MQYFQLLLINLKSLFYKAFFILIVILIYSSFLLMSELTSRIKYWRVGVLCPIKLLKITLPVVVCFVFCRRRQRVSEEPYFYYFNIYFLLLKRINIWKPLFAFVWRYLDFFDNICCYFRYYHKNIFLFYN